MSELTYNQVTPQTFCSSCNLDSGCKNIFHRHFLLMPLLVLIYMQFSRLAVTRDCLKVKTAKHMLNVGAGTIISLWGQNSKTPLLSLPLPYICSQDTYLLVESTSLCIPGTTSLLNMTAARCKPATLGV